MFNIINLFTYLINFIISQNYIMKKMVSNENFWNLHTLNDFQQLLIYQNVHSYEITSVCFLKDVQ